MNIVRIKLQTEIANSMADLCKGETHLAPQVSLFPHMQIPCYVRFRYWSKVREQIEWFGYLKTFDDWFIHTIRSFNSSLHEE